MNFTDDDFRFAFLFSPKRIMPKDKQHKLKSIIKKNNKVVGYEVGSELISVEKAIDMAKVGLIDGVRVVTPAIKDEYLVDSEKGIRIDNLDIDVIEE